MTLKDWIIIVVMFLCLLFVGIGVTNRYQIVGEEEGAFRLNKITGKVTWIVGDTMQEVRLEKKE
jgi:hypothetical protein